MVCFSSVFGSCLLFRQRCKEQPLHLDGFFTLRFALLAFPTTVHLFATRLLLQSEEFMDEDGQFPINLKKFTCMWQVYQAYLFVVILAANELRAHKGKVCPNYTSHTH